MQTFGKSLSFLDVLYSVRDPVTANLETSDNIVFSLSFPITKIGITIVSTNPKNVCIKVVSNRHWMTFKS